MDFLKTFGGADRRGRSQYGTGSLELQAPEVPCVRFGEGSRMMLPFETKLTPFVIVVVFVLFIYLNLYYIILYYIIF